jgi:serine protease inhibitor
MKMNHRPAAVTMLLLLVFGLLASGCREAIIGAGGNITMPEPKQEVLDSFEPALSGAANRMGIKLFARLLEEGEEIFISPTSISTK